MINLGVRTPGSLFSGMCPFGVCGKAESVGRKRETIGRRDRRREGVAMKTRTCLCCVGAFLLLATARSEGRREPPMPSQPPGDGGPHWIQLENARPFDVKVRQGARGDIVVEMTLDRFCAKPEEIGGRTLYHICLPGEPVSTVAGAPELPFVPRSLLVSDTEFMVATVDSAVYTDLPNMPTAPSRGPLPLGVSPETLAHEFGPAYAGGALYPQAVASLGPPFILRDFRGEVLEIHPFQTRPRDGMLRVYTYVRVSVVPGGADTANIIERSNPPATIDRQFARIYEEFFLNYVAIEQQGYLPRTRDDKLLIVTPGDCTYCDELDRLVEWKVGRGLPTEVVTTTQIGSGTFQGIRQYIRTRYAADDIAYVLLVGDYDDIPPLMVNYPGDPNVPEDPPYTLMNDQDHFPDIFVGRFSANDRAQLATQVDRTIAFERDLDPHEGWLGRAFGMASNLDIAPPAGYGSNTAAMDDWLGRLRASGRYATSRLYDADDPPEGEVTNLLNQLHNGFGIMLVSDLGSPDGWDTRFPRQGTAPTTMRRAVVDDEEFLHNTDRLPLIHAHSNSLGRFSYSDSIPNECFAESWMWARRHTDGAPAGAAAAYMPGGVIDDAGPQYAQLGAVLSLLDEEAPAVGRIVYSGAIFMMLEGVRYKNFEIWNLFGDPSLIFPAGVAQTIDVSGEGEAGPVEEAPRIGPTPSAGPVRMIFRAGRGDAGSQAEIRVFDPSGRCVRTLVAKVGAGDVQSILWDGRDDRGNVVPSGAYLCRLGIGSREITQRVVMVR
jgi:hypothetical protein